ncbi:hypothetical protein E2C01_070737 [Portunus trituberculatus]|uniref:Uncharacterized protein n=1 Tax=Portunus trituberculatus TaxID=210409 RepID=A0A5B7I4F0_PORTR|nr:hypothetical protein [Portunus trituberculatus]
MVRVSWVMFRFTYDDWQTKLQLKDLTDEERVKDMGMPTLEDRKNEEI